MTELANKDEAVVRRVLPRDEAVAYFKGLGEHYKAEIIASIPSNEDVSLYREGCLLYTSPSPRDGLLSRMPSSA